MALPLLLAGPILRRVESNLVTVWLALSQEAQVSLSVWEGMATAGAPNPFVTSTPELTWRLGDKLHLALVTARIPETAGKSLQPDVLYSYDVAIKIGATTHTLASLHMLRDAKPEDSPDGLAHLALGYQPDLLPSFTPCASKLTDVRILYGSCRLPSCRDPDALAYVDDYIHDHVQDPRSRPHQLILGGDQVYADDVDTLMMIGLIDLAAELIGVNNPNDPTERTPVEQLLVDKVLRRTVAPGDADTIDPAKAYEAYAEDASIAPADRRLPVDAATFPPGHRLELTKRAAQLTSQDGTNHVLSFGEFAALYVLVWSNACWRNEIAGTTFVPDATTDTSGTTRQPLTWTSKLTPKSRIDLPPLVFPELVSEHLYPPPDPLAKPDTRSADQKAKDEQTEEHKRQQELRRSHKIHADFLLGLPKVQRALANVPTYMMLDDHEITDDLFLSPTWRDRVLSLGARPVAVQQRHARVRAVPGLGQRPAALRQRAARRAAYPGSRAVPGGRHHRSGHGAVRAAVGAVRTRPAQRPRRRGWLPRRQPADPLALHRRCADPPVDLARQPHPPQLRLAPRPARQRVGRRDGRPGAQAAAARRPAAARGDRPAAGDRPAGHRRPRGSGLVPRLRPRHRGEQQVQHLGPVAAQPHRAAPDVRHQPRRHRDVGDRRPRVRTVPREARAVPSASCCSRATCTTPRRRR